MVDYLSQFKHPTNEHGEIACYTPQLIFHHVSGTSEDLELKEKLEDPDPGVQSAAVNVICELARKNPRNYLSLAPTFFKLMTTSQNNWMLIKIIKLFGALTPLEPRLGMDFKHFVDKFASF